MLGLQTVKSSLEEKGKVEEQDQKLLDLIIKDIDEWSHKVQKQKKSEIIKKSEVTEEKKDIEELKEVSKEEEKEQLKKQNEELS